MTNDERAGTAAAVPDPTGFRDRLAHALEPGLGREERSERVHRATGAFEDADVMAEALRRHVDDHALGEMLTLQAARAGASLKRLDDEDLAGFGERMAGDLESGEGKPDGAPGRWRRLYVTRGELEMAIAARSVLKNTYDAVEIPESATATLLANAGDGVAVAAYRRRGTGGYEPTGGHHVGLKALEGLLAGFGAVRSRRIDATPDAALADLPLSGYDRTGAMLDDAVHEDVERRFSVIGAAWERALADTKRTSADAFVAGLSAKAGGRDKAARPVRDASHGR